MRIHSVRITGFGPFKEEQIVDFSPFDGDVFLIDGQTGAGKSSILDAIAYALYGSVPRYSGKAGENVRSDHCADGDPTEVSLEFLTNGVSYRVTRNPEYIALGKRKGLVTQKSDALLETFENGAWVAKAQSLKEVGHELSRILPLNANQFLQVIMLAQNQFMDFLVSKSEERLQLLRLLFDSTRFQSIEETFDARAKLLSSEVNERRRDATGFQREAREALQQASQHTEIQIPENFVIDVETPTSEYFDLIVNLLHAQLELASDSLAEADKRRTTAEEQLNKLNKLQGHREQLKQARETIERLEGQSQKQVGRKQQLDSAVRATPAFHAITERDSQMRSVQVAKQQRDDLYEQLRSLGVDVSDKGSVTDELKRVRSAVARGESLSEDEAELRDLTTVLSQLTRKSNQLEGEIELLEKQKQDCEKTFGNLTQQRETAVEKAKSREAFQKEYDSAVQRAQAARDVAKLSRELAKASEAESNANSEFEKAEENLSLLRNRQLGEMVARLASELKDGVPCSVCGSGVHPAPAPIDTERVEESDIQAADVLKKSTLKQRDSASSHAQSIRHNLENAEQIAAGADVENAEKLVAEIEAQLKVASKAQELADDLKSQIDSKTDELNGLGNQMGARREDISAVLSDKKNAEKQLKELRRKIDEFREDFETVSARVASLGELEVRLTSLEDAIRSCEDAEAAHERAIADFEAALEQSGFSSEPEVRKSFLEPDVVDDLKSEISQYEADLVAAKKLMQDAPADALSNEPLDIDGAQNGSETAKKAYDEKFKLHSTLNSCAEIASAAASNFSQLSIELGEALEKYERVQSLASTFTGKEPNEYRMRLESFVLAAKLEEITLAANERLKTMTSSQFEMQYDDEVESGKTRSGLGLKVFDNYTGRTRPPESLSGGEKFLASLALALGLAEVVSNNAGGVHLDTLFIDEGFAALDEETLAVAMNSIQDLRAGGRTVGLISHVSSMKDQIPNKLHVTKTANGDSTISLASVP